MDDYLHAIKALSDPHRLRVFWLLAHIDERISVGEAMAVLGVLHYNASRHLTILKQARLVLAKREGKQVFYSLNRNGGPFINAMLAAVRTIPASHFETEITSCKKLLGLR